LVELGETPFELLKDEQEGTVVNAIFEKQVNALNESLIKFFKQGITLGHGVRSYGVMTTFICHICGFGDHVASIYPIIGDLKPKCGKCGLPHRTKNCGLQCGYYNNMGHTKEWCGKNGRNPNQIMLQIITWNYLLMIKQLH